MAKIEMDVSEYDALRENEKLLETSLERERAMQNTIAELNKEKIKLLEDAKMKVVKVTKSEVAEYALIAQPIEHIKHWLHVTLCGNLIESSFYRDNRGPYQDRNDNRNSIVEHISSAIGVLDVNRLMDVCFTKTAAHSFPVRNEEYTTVGLDEVKAELRNSIEAEITADIKSELERAAKLNETNTALLAQNKTLTNECSQLQTEYKKVGDLLIETQLQISNDCKAQNQLTKITTIINTPNTMWAKNNSNKISQILRVLQQ